MPFIHTYKIIMTFLPLLYVISYLVVSLTCNLFTTSMPAVGNRRGTHSFNPMSMFHIPVWTIVSILTSPLDCNQLSVYCNPSEKVIWVPCFLCFFPPNYWPLAIFFFFFSAKFSCKIWLLLTRFSLVVVVGRTPWIPDYSGIFFSL